MFEMPPTAPPNVPHECIIAAAAHYDVPALALVLIRLQEAGKPGMANLNRDGTFDYGVMQINTVNVDNVSRALGVDKKQLRDDGCTSVYGAAYLLKTHLVRTAGDVWKSIGDYHNRRAVHHDRYLGHVRKRYDRLLEKHADYVQWLVNASLKARGRLAKSNIGPLISFHGLSTLDMSTAGVNTAQSNQPYKHPYWVAPPDPIETPERGVVIAPTPAKASSAVPSPAAPTPRGVSHSFRAAFLGGVVQPPPPQPAPVGLATQVIAAQPTIGFDDLALSDAITP